MQTLYNMLEENPKIFDDTSLIPQLDLGILVDTMIKEYGTCDVVYYNPSLFKYYSDIWFKRKYNIIRELYETTQFEYDPIENYRRYEDGWENNDDTENRERGTTRNLDTTNHKDVTNHNDSELNGTEGTVGNTSVTGKVTDEVDSATETKNMVSPFNAETFLNDTQSNSSSHSTQTTNTTNNTDVTNNVTTKNNTTDDFTSAENENGNEIEKQDETEKTDNERRKKYGSLAHGNIGVTTTQQMIEQERQVVQFDLYLWIANKWADENIVGIW